MSNASYLIPVQHANCGGLAQGFYNQGLLTDEFTLHKGDIPFYNFNGGSPQSDWVPYPSCQHTGIAITDPDENGYFYAIEGNTGDSAYGEVVKKYRNISDVSCVGHPQYDDKVSADMIIKTATAEIGTKASEGMVVKYNTWFYGNSQKDNSRDWCSVFDCWVFEYTETDEGSASAPVNIIDVSSCQGEIDWKAVAVAGIKYAILRIGLGDLASQKDSCFEYNYKNAKANGIKVGGYWFCYVGDDPVYEDYEKDAELEAQVCLSIIKGKTFDLPIYHDLEAKSTQTSKIQKATLKFCQTIERAGYKAGVYASIGFIQSYLNVSALSDYSLWIAYYSSTKPSIDCDIWQYSDSGKVSGISTVVDLDKMFSDPGGEGSVIAYANMKMQLCGGKYKGREGVIRDIQRILSQCKNKSGKFYDVKVTGVYDAKTIQAVKEYQEKFGLPVTGICDEKTLKSIFSCE